MNNSFEFRKATVEEIRCPKCGNIFTVNEAEYLAIVEQVKNKEFDKEVGKKLKEVEEKALQQAEIRLTTAISAKDKELADKMLEIEKLKNDIKLNKTNLALEVAKATAEKDKIIVELSSSIEVEKSRAEVEKAQLVEKHNNEIKLKDEQIEYYKDFKIKMSTKLLGESLEQHCETEFNKIRMTAFPNATFKKDNDAKDGTKGDYIYRELTPEGVEILSIMFEMKNENDETATKHKNADFFKKLDKDRNEKKCEYAVLVSMLEQDSEYYNAGIVDVSYAYDKMYVVRPQNFIQIISLLRGMAMRSLEVKKELAVMKHQEIDIVNFETKLLEFQRSFAKSVNNASNNFKKTVEGIDKAIEQLKKAKEALLLTEKQLTIADNKAQDLSVKKMIKGNKTLTEMYDSAWTDSVSISLDDVPEGMTRERYRHIMLKQKHNDKN